MIDALKDSLHAGFIDHKHASTERFRPKLLVNNHLEGKKVSTSIMDELSRCDEFFFSVAFITYSGLLVLLNTLKELEEKNIKGKIVASNYLNFTEPKALERLLSLKNIELKMVVDDNLHSKGYIFRKNTQYDLIIGSSNMTQNALSRNKEWNLKVSSMEEGSIVLDTLGEFEKTFDSGISIDKDWIDEYSKIYKANKSKRSIFTNSELLSNVAENYEVNPFTSMMAKIMPNAMQVEALKGIEKIRLDGQDRALLISATGTGKTYLACFDVAKVKPKKLLFIAHREQLINQAIKSFQNVLGPDIDIGKVTGGIRDTSCPFTFSTIQTMSKDDVLNSIDSTYYDYIIVDESHKAGAKSYQKLLNYFEPKFLLGMTATPERTDDYNICKDFNYNIAYEIRLEQAMREDMLCPFHYFGISDFEVDGKELSDASDFLRLTSDSRVDHIIEKIKFYSHNGDKTKGLVFCSKNDEAEKLSKLFNKKGYKTLALSGENSQVEREEAIERLEADSGYDRLDYIFTVDIFNEGVDIPRVNQVIMLRPTQSAIVFVQQLGRGLRKHREKEYVVILDFIGNYKNNFMIPIALSDDRSFNKDTIRRFVAEGNRVIPGSSTINFDSISRKKIYESIDSANFSSVTFIKERYKNLKYRLGRIPKLLDFDHHDSLDIARVFESASLKSYHTFLKKYEPEYTIKLNELEEKFIECISVKFAKGKRPHELLLLKAIIDNKSDIFKDMENQLGEHYHIRYADKTKVNLINILTNEFATGSSKNTYKKCQFIKLYDYRYIVSDEFAKCLENPPFYECIKELVELGLYRYKKYYGKSYNQSSFQLYQKYTYEDVCRLLEWEKNVVSLNIGGYKYDEKSKSYPVFINYHKEDDISETTKYEDKFLSNDELVAISKAKRTVNSNDVRVAYSARELGVSIELFIKKNKNDEGSKEFYYLGKMNTIHEPEAIKMVDGITNAVKLTYKLETAVREDIYDYITQA